MNYYIQQPELNAGGNLGDLVYIYGLKKFLIKNNINVKHIIRDQIPVFIPEGDDNTIIMSGWYSNNTKEYYNNPHFIYKYCGFFLDSSVWSDKAIINITDKTQYIGCRDVYTYEMCKRSGLNAYISLCPSLLLDKNDFNINEINRDLIILAGVPNIALKLFNLNDKNIYKYPWFYDPHKKWNEIEEYFIKTVNFFLSRAKVVYTTRLHVYLMCLSLDIPVKYVGDFKGRKQLAAILLPENIHIVKELVRKNFEYFLLSKGEDNSQELTDLILNYKELYLYLNKFSYYSKETELKFFKDNTNKQKK